MTPAELLRCIRNPPESSLVGHMTRHDGRAMRGMPFVIMFNLAWVFFWPLIAKEPFLTVILPTLLTVPLFAYLHLSTYFYGGPPRKRFYFVLGVYALGFGLAPLNLASLGYIIFAFFTTSFTLHIRQAVITIASAIVAFAIETILLGGSFQTVLSVIFPAVLLGLTAIYTAYTTFQQKLLRRSNDEIMRLATLAERERIGRDLHDLLGHTLSVVALKSELARKLIDRDLDAARVEIGEVEVVARDALQQVRTAVSGIRTTAIASELVAATALLEAQGVKVKCETENVKLPHDRETALALSLREATTNIRRHAFASGVTIRLRQEPLLVIMEVLDNGRGGRIVPGNGLTGMRERLTNVGGTLLFETADRGGTRLCVSVPAAA